MPPYHQDRTLARRQVLHRGDEGELDRLPLLISGVWRGVAVLDLEHPVAVGVQLAAVGLDEPLELGFVGSRRRRHRPKLATALSGDRCHPLTKSLFYLLRR